MNLEPTTSEPVAEVKIPATISRPGTTLPPALTEGPTASELWHAFRRRWLPAFGLGLPLAVAVGVVTWFFLVPSRYTASALLHVSSTPPHILKVGEGGPDFYNYQRTQATLIKNRFVLNTALRQPRIADLPTLRFQTDATGWLARELKVDSSLGPEIIRVSLSLDNPEDASAIVNAVTDAYLREIVNKEQHNQQARVDRLKEIHGQYDENLRSRRRTLRQLAETAGSSDQSTLVFKQRFAMEQLGMSQRELLDLQSQVRRLQVEVANQEARGPAEATLPDSYVEGVLRTDPIAQPLYSRITELKSSIERTLKVVIGGEDSSVIKRMRSELAEANQALADRRKELEPQLIQMYRENLDREQQGATKGMRERQGVLQDLEKAVSADVERLSQQTRAINKQSLDLESLREEISLTENIAKQIGSEIEHLKVELQAPARVQLLEGAEAPRSRDIKKQAGMTGLAALGAFLCCVGGLTLLEYRARRVHSVDALVRGLGLRLVGAVPAVPDRLHHTTASTSLESDVYWQDLLMDSVDSARTMLLHHSGRTPLRVVLVTSASPGEGKTTLSSQLAQSLARTGLRTLLIDGDLRKPDTHRLFGLNGEIGLSEVLRGEAGIVDAIQATTLENLWVMPAGNCDERTIPALARPCLQQVLTAVRERYDFVLIDSAPILPVADSLLLGRHVDGVVLSTMRSVSRLAEVYEAYERLTTLNVAVLGVVMNAVSGSYYGVRYRRSLQPVDATTSGGEGLEPAGTEPTDRGPSQE